MSHSPDGARPEMVGVPVCQEHKLDVSEERLNFHERHADINQYLVLDDHGVTL